MYPEDAVDWVLENRVDMLSSYVFNIRSQRRHPYSENDFYCWYGGTLHIDESLGLLTFKPEFEGFSLENDYEAIYELKNDQLIIASGTVNSRTRPTTFSPAIGSCVDRCRKVAAKTNR